MSVILMYHRVAELRHDPYGLAVHPDRFAAQVEHLLRLGNTVPLEETTGRGSRVAITFDDGYADNATVAAPLLADAGLPATWFITTSTLGRRRFWWDRLAAALLGAHPLPDSVDVEIAGRDIWLDLSTPTARSTALRFLHRRVLPLPPDTVQASVDLIIDMLGSPKPTDDNLTMTIEQLKELASLPLQQIGAHTRTHVHLGGQPEELQRSEILGSVSDLSNLLARPVLDFAYPFGGPGTFDPLAPRLAEEAGCRLAVTTTHGRVSRRSNRYRIPRLNVLDWDADAFSEQLRRTLAGH